ncbi:MAG: acyl-CoA dehydrogenase family protein [Rhodococcus sp. (in: high G+C Gram-positive bacteria)]|uniref:acyl-CoA dehydrogenase family protein n=1 Tax=Rhodococcus sp. TaxID=1831 RepID=UPI003BAF62C1
MANTGNRELTDMLDAVLSGRRGDNHVVSGPLEIDRELWATLEELGLTRLTAAEDRGGSGASWTEAALLLSAAGGGAARIPVAENDLLAQWLLGVAGIESSDGLIRTACVLDGSGSARDVPWARGVDRIVVLWNSPDGWHVADVDRGAFEITEAVNLAQEPRDHVRIDVTTLTGAPVGAETAPGFQLRGALARTQLMAGAMERILDLVVDHTTARTQFGRPLAKFQAVQFMAADIAAESALARAAADAAVATAVQHGFDSEQAGFAIAAAKSCAGHAASVVARTAHQALGAIGFTMEHELHRHANRILSWRSEFGSVRHWDTVLTAAVVEAGSAGLWPLVVEDED